MAGEGAAPPPRRVAEVEGIVEYRLHNGLRALLVEDPSQANITVNITDFVGSRHEGYGESGMALPASSENLPCAIRPEADRMRCPGQGERVHRVWSRTASS